MTAVLGSFVTLILGGSATGYFLSPLFESKEEGWVDLGRADAFKAETPTKVEFVERKRDAWVTTEHRASAWVVASEGTAITVFDPRCTHLGCPFRWNVLDKRFLCPCHTAAFDIKGLVVGGPAPRALDRYPAKVVEQRLLIQPAAREEKETEKP